MAQKRIVFQGATETACQVQHGVVAEVQAAGFDDNECFAIRLALDEAVSNAIKHGNGGDTAKSVILEYEITDQQVRITVQDQGGGFDPEDVPDPTDPSRLECPNGRGVMLMRAYMSDVHYNEAGNRVTMIKHRSDAASNRQSQPAANA